MLRDYQLAIEFRNRNWVIGEQFRETIEFLETASRDFLLTSMLPAAEHFTIMPSNLDEITIRVWRICGFTDAMLVPISRGKL